MSSVVLSVDKVSILCFKSYKEDTFEEDPLRLSIEVLTSYKFEKLELSPVIFTSFVSSFSVFTS